MNISTVPSSLLQRLLLIFYILGTLWLMGLLVFEGCVRSLKIPSPVTTQGLVVFTGGRGRLYKADTLKNFCNSFYHISGTKERYPFQKKPLFDIRPQTVETCSAAPHQRKNIAITGDCANNTQENCRLSHGWMMKKNIHTARLITSNYHIPRCLLWKWHYRWPTKIIWHPVRSGRYYRVFHIVREYSKWLMTLVHIVYLKIAS